LPPSLPKGVALHRHNRPAARRGSGARRVGRAWKDRGMTQIPAGWYPDPDTSNPGAPQGQRYWDGQQWTEHVQPPPGQYPAGPGATYGGTGGPVPTYTPMAPYSGAPAAVATTPDGQTLAGWWQRVGAYVIDLLILTPLVFIFAWPWISDVVSAYGDLISEAMDASRAGGQLPDQSDLLAEIALPLLMVSLVGLALNFVYNVGFLKWKSATPGKFALGLRVRLRETPGPMSWGTVLMRWLGQNWYAAASAVPVLGSLLSLYPLVDLLWPLWDDKKQALHDKVAKTNVVRVR
jgi:uncharacterized RDD family membrane protein YckC